MTRHKSKRDILDEILDKTHLEDVNVRAKQLVEAVRVVDAEYTPNLSLELDLKAIGSQRFGKDLYVFSDIELQQLNSLRDLIVQYAGQRAVARPLCLAVFGPPGSGKSFAVKQIRSEVESHSDVKAGDIRLPMTTVNLTQVTASSDVGTILARIAGEQDEKTIPIVFFDEFDATRNGGSPLGWLVWFLAPMHDGEFLHGGAAVRLKRIVYVFAGGTAATMEEFSRRSSDGFRAAKGPDFVSRLRGFLDVQGPNAVPQVLRRAVVLRSELAAKARRNGKGSFKLDRNLLESLLLAGRFRHGARSIAAIVELSHLNAETRNFDWQKLPDDHLLELHIDRGALDSRRIFGSIAMSGYASKAVGAAEASAAAGVDHVLAPDLGLCWLSVANALWQEGATLTYAGNWQVDKSSDLMSLLIEDLKALPLEPSRNDKRRGEPSARLISFIDGKRDASTMAQIGKHITDQDRIKCGMQLNFRDYLPDDERQTLSSQLLKNAVQMFRQRLDAAESSVARFAVGGATSHHLGRMPGVADEVMISLAMGHPVYIAGGFGGAAAEIGRLLALGGTRSGEVGDSLKDPQGSNNLNVIAEKFRPPPWNSLPVTASEAGKFFKDHALGGEAWPENGLSAVENRRLFDSTDCLEVASLVVTGLRRVFSDR